MCSANKLYLELLSKKANILLNKVNLIQIPPSEKIKLIINTFCMILLLCLDMSQNNHLKISFMVMTGLQVRVDSCE